MSVLRISTYIFLAALFVRAFTAFPGISHPEMGGAYTADSPRYDRLAMTLIKEGVYEAHPIIDHKGLDEYRGPNNPMYSGPEYFRVPGYPAFLSMIYSVTGFSTTAAIVVQIILSAMTCVLVFLVGRELHSVRLGVVAATLLVLHVKIGVNAGQITSETPFIFLLVACLLSAIFMLKNFSLKTASYCAILFALMALTRPIGLHLAVLFMIFVLLFSRYKKATLVSAFVPLLAVGLALNAWSYRNYTKSGVWAPTSNAAITLGIFFPAIVWAHANDKTMRDGQLEMLRRSAEVDEKYRWVYEQAQKDPIDLFVWSKGLVHDIKFAEHLKPIGIRLMLDEWKVSLYTMATSGVWSLFSGANEWRSWIMTPAEYQVIKDKRYVANIKKSMGNLELKGAAGTFADMVSDLPAKVIMVFLFMGIYQIVFLSLALLGIRRLFTDVSLRPISGVIVIWILYILATAGLSGNARYTAPALPLLSIVAAYGWITVRSYRGMGNNIR